MQETYIETINSVTYQGEITSSIVQIEGESKKGGNIIITATKEEFSGITGFSNGHSLDVIVKNTPRCKTNGNKIVVWHFQGSQYKVKNNDFRLYGCENLVVQKDSQNPTEWNVFLNDSSTFLYKIKFDGHF